MISDTALLRLNAGSFQPTRPPDQPEPGGETRLPGDGDSRLRILTVIGAALLVGAEYAPGQRAQQVELGVFATYTRYDRAFNLEDAPGAGGRLGFFLTDHLGIEVDVGMVSPDAATAGTAADLAHGSASVVLNLPAGDDHVLFLLGGYSRLDFEPTAPYRFTDDAFHVGVGDRIVLGTRVALRLEARMIYAPETAAAFGPAWAGHVVGAAGLSVFVGAASDRDVDSDGDGVADGSDACPATPRGGVTTPEGCPRDSDGDGVYNGLDTCPNSPPGVLTDRHGCPADGDGDGVYDGIDQCPGTPGGATVDSHGCSTDEDGDGIADHRDECPDTPAGAVVDAAGCLTDGDGDHIPDGLDRCPGTRAGARVDAVGCPTGRDSDGDGVDDADDRCPRTAPGTAVDTIGCPPLFSENRTPVILHGVTFETARSVLSTTSHVALDAVAASLVANPEVRIEIAGHTDAVGSRDVNQQLSQARADAVRAYLARRGVAPARMVARGYGETQPAASNATPDGRAQNRRVELRLLP